MFDLMPGVRAGRQKICSGDDAAAHAVGLAEEAAHHGTFGVGGFLLDREGHVIAEAVNAVVREGNIVDPTAHVERQLVDWYSQASQKGFPVSSTELTIVCSVDPCAMCAGAILRSGMSVIAIAEDKMSGVHDGGNPHRMPHELWRSAEKHMALFGVRGLRLSSHNSISFFTTLDISSELLHRAEQAFVISVDPVNRLIADQGLELDRGNLKLTTTSIRKTVSKACELLGVYINESSIGLNVHDQNSRMEILRSLSGDGSMLVDELGTVIFTKTRSKPESAAGTSVMELVRAYSIIRSIAEKKLGVILPHQRYCSVVKQKAHTNPAKALLEFGALGAFFAAPRKRTIVPAVCYLEPTNLVQSEIFAASLPPLYTSIIGIDVGLISESTS
jgi:cytosine deaminase